MPNCWKRWGRRPISDVTTGAALEATPAPLTGGAPAARTPRIAWAMLAALFVAYIVSFVDRMIIGLLVEGIKADLGISDTQVSLLQGLAFALFFTLAALPIGRLIDRVHRPRAVAAGIAVWSAMTIACGQMTSFAGLFVARMGVGVGEAVLSPAAYSIIADSFPRRRLGLAMGIFGLGSAVGAGLAFMIGGAVVALVAGADSIALPLFGTLRPWQLAFVIAGLAGLPLALLFLLLRDPGRGGGAGAAPVVPLRAVRGELFGRGGMYLCLLAGVAAVNVSTLGTVNWLPAMFLRGFGLPLAQAGYLAGALLIAGGLIGMIGGGWVMDRLGGAPAMRLRFCGIAVGCAIVAAIAFPLVSSLWLAGLLFVLFLAPACAVVSAAPSVLQELAPPGMRATIAAVYVFVVNGVGIGFGPSLTAALGDTVFPGGDGIRYAMAIVAPLGYAIGSALFFVAARRASRAIA